MCGESSRVDKILRTVVTILTSERKYGCDDLMFQHFSPKFGNIIGRFVFSSVKFLLREKRKVICSSCVCTLVLIHIKKSNFSRI